MNRSASLLGWPLALLLVFSYVFINTAWVSEDAFITFRSVDQLLAGNGPVWNLGERVQVYTHPLWYGLLSLGTGLGLPSYWLSLLLSYLCLLGVLLLLGRQARVEGASPALLAGLALLLTLSRAFVDYSSSGLENPLLHLLLLVHIALYRSASPLARKYGWAVFVYGLLFLTRPDGIILTAPLMLHLWLQMLQARQPWLKSTLLALLPVLGWELFSLIYYGSPVPNTALAKLNMDYSPAVLHYQARNYFRESWLFDPLSLGLIGLALPVGLLGGLGRRRPLPPLLALGLALQLAYLYHIGGDYMGGRFLSASVLLAVVLLLALLGDSRWPTVRRATLTRLGQRWRWPGLALLALLLVLLSPNYRFTPDYRNFHSRNAFNDQRGYNYPSHGLLPVLLRPDSHYLGREEKSLPGRLVVACFIGFHGWRLPLEREIIDPMALAEPFLARLPAADNQNTGHYERALPPGYLPSRLEGKNLLQNKELAALYDDVWWVTRSPALFSRERWAAIWRLNSGHYQHLEFAFRRNEVNLNGVEISERDRAALRRKAGTICTDAPIALH